MVLPLLSQKCLKNWLCVIKYQTDASQTNSVIFDNFFYEEKILLPNFPAAFALWGRNFGILGNISLCHVELVGQVVIICQQLLPLLVQGVQPMLGTLQPVFSF
jgi:hypothetical protein